MSHYHHSAFRDYSSSGQFTIFRSSFHLLAL